MTDGPSWTTIESDPGVFTALVGAMGVHGVQARMTASPGGTALRLTRACAGGGAVLAGRGVADRAAVRPRPSFPPQQPQKFTPTARRPVYGLIFLFKWQQGVQEVAPNVVHDPRVFFASQMITNACATQAMLAVLLNQGEAVELGSDLTNLKVRSWG